MCKASVVIGTYNERPQYIADLIASLNAQTFDDFEIIIVDDSNSRETIECWKMFATRDSRIKYLNTGERGYLSKSLNKGIRMASSEYIIRLDSDDILLPQRIKMQLDFMKKNPLCQVSGSHVIKIDENGMIIGDRKYPLNDSIISKIFIRNPIVHSASIIRKEFFDKYGLYDESYPHGEDYELWMRAIYNNCHILNLDEFLIKLRMPPSTRRSRLHWKYNLKTKAKYFRFDKYILNRIIGFAAVLGLYLLPESLRTRFYHYYNKV